MNEDLEIKLPDDMDFGTEEEILQEKYKMELLHVQQLIDEMKRVEALPVNERNDSYVIDNLQFLYSTVESIAADYKKNEKITFRNIDELKAFLEDKMNSISKEDNPNDNKNEDNVDKTDKQKLEELEKQAEKRHKLNTLKRELLAKRKELREKIKRLSELKKKDPLTDAEKTELDQLVKELPAIQNELNELATKIKEIDTELKSMLTLKEINAQKSVLKPTSKNNTREKIRKKENEAEKNQPQIVTPVISSAPSFSTAPATTPSTTSEKPKESITDYNKKFLDNKIKEFAKDGKVRGASGISFNYIEPILDKDGKIVDCIFVTDNLNQTRYGIFKFANDPLRAYKHVVNKKMQQIEKMQLFTLKDKIDLGKFKKELISDFENHLKNNNPDYCVEKMMAICTAITRDEVVKVLKEKEYPLDNYNVAVAKMKTSTPILQHSEKAFNKRFIFNLSKEKTISDLHPTREKKESHFRIKRAEQNQNRRRLIRRRKNKNINKDTDMDR